MDAGPLMLVDLITQQSSRLVVPVYQRPYSWSEENPGKRVGRDFAAGLPISSGRVEGTNSMIKTARGQAYGLPDDGCFFLKAIDASHGKDRW